MKTRKRMRLEGYDYSNSGQYFITTNIGTKDFVLSNIIDAEVVLTEYGKIVSNCWYDLPYHYPNCLLDEFIIMPDHVHGIIVIDKEAEVGTKHGLSELMRAFKSFSSRRINEIAPIDRKFKWQTSFHERIIRDEKALINIRNYIKRNPAKWWEKYKNK